MALFRLKGLFFGVFKTISGMDSPTSAGHTEFAEFGIVSVVSGPEARAFIPVVTKGMNTNRSISG